MDPIMLEKFKTVIRENGMKFTPQRLNVLRIIVNSEGHMDVEELLLKCRKQGKNVSRATLYRTMDLLVKTGFVNKLDFGDGIARYERSSGIPHHDHMLCTECGKIKEFQNEEIEMLQNTVCEQSGFHPTSHKLHIYGLCSTCHQQNN